MDNRILNAPNCKETVLSENTYDYITDFSLSDFIRAGEAFCYANIDDLYNIVYLEGENIPDWGAMAFQYQSIPKLYSLTPITGGTGGFNPDALIASGILQVQREPLNLTGRGCVICFIDTGIDFTMDAFKDDAGNSRILAIWDQTIQTGQPPEGFVYGSEYRREEINRALSSEDPFAIVPSRDVNGHGTIMASLAAGSPTSGPQRLVGAAPEADIVVVKLKECKEYLRRMMLIPQGAVAYQENDIMLAVQYADSFAGVLNRPVIICLGLGTNMGDHAGNSILSRYLNSVAVRRSRAVVVCGGDEGNAAHHFKGRQPRLDNANTASPSDENDMNVEVRVADGCSGFVMECWSSLPDTLQVGVRSPGGEEIPPLRIGSGQNLTYRLVYEDTIITLGTTLVEPSSGEQLLRFRLQNPTPGIWTFEVTSPGTLYNGTFDMWLPVTEFLDAPVYFLRPDPYITITEPAMASEVITVTNYNPSNLSFAIDSGRGFARTGIIRPDFAAPGVNVSTIEGPQSGSALAAAITAGAVAQLFQWAVVEKRSLYAESRELKSYLIRGAARSDNLSYPNRDRGYGRLNIEGVFESLRE